MEARERCSYVAGLGQKQLGANVNARTPKGLMEAALWISDEREARVEEEGGGGRSLILLFRFVATTAQTGRGE